MKVGTVFVILVFVLSLIGSVVGTSYYYLESIAVVKEQAYKQLEGVSQSRASHIISWLDEHYKIADVFSKSLTFKRVLTTEKTNPNYGGFVDSANVRLSLIKEAYDEVLRISVTDKNGNVVLYSESDKYPLGEPIIEVAEPSFPAEGFKKSTHICERHKIPCTDYGLPIFDDNGEFIGGIVIDLDMGELNEITLDKSGLGLSGETYLIDSDYYAVTRLLFVEDAVLKQKVDSVNSRNCFEAKDYLGETFRHVGHEAVETYLDYQGGTVIGTHIYIPEMDWCLLAEVDEAEVLGAQRDLFRRVALTIVISIVSIFSLVGFLVGRQLDKATVFKRQKKKL